MAAMSPYVDIAREVTLEEKTVKAGIFFFFPALLIGQSGIAGCQGDSWSGIRMHLMNPASTLRDNCAGEKTVPTPKAALMG